MGLIPDTTRVIFNEASKIERQVDFTNVVDIYRNINYNQLSKFKTINNPSSIYIDFQIKYNKYLFDLLTHHDYLVL